LPLAGEAFGVVTKRANLLDSRTSALSAGQRLDNERSPLQPHPALLVSPPTPSTDTPQVLAEIGAQLRQTRMNRGQSIAELSGRLNMGQEQLQALESANLAKLPEPVFVIAQIRRVASTLGVDVEGSIQELRRSEALRSPAAAEPGPGAAKRAAGGPGTSPNQPRSRRPWLKPLAAVVAVPLLGWLGFSGWMHWQRTLLQNAAPAALQGQSTRGAATPASAADQLTLSSKASSWLAVRDNKGTMLFEGTFTGQKRFPVGRGLEVLAGRPDLVLASLGGTTPEPLGPIEAVRWRRVSPTPAQRP
jgi:cytoskeleton protein RodZ